MCVGACGAFALLFYPLTSVGTQPNSLLVFCFTQMVVAWDGIKSRPAFLSQPSPDMNVDQYKGPSSYLREFFLIIHNLH